MIRNLVAAIAPNGGIGFDGKMPWDCKDDMRRFVSLTKGHCVIMGRKTYESIGHPLKNRLNVILTSDKGYKPKGVPDNTDSPSVACSIDEAEQIAAANGYKDEVFYIGGAVLFQELIDRDLADTIYLTVIKNVPESTAFDTYFPHFSDFFKEGRDLVLGKYKAVGLTETETCAFYDLFRVRHDKHCDDQYQELLRDILENGVDTPTRVGEARSVFDAHLKFDLREGLPVLTTKKMALKSVIVELLWFLKGCENIKYLTDRNVHIWDKDAYAYYMKIMNRSGDDILPFDDFMKNVEFGTSKMCKDGSVYKFGDVGVIYGSQWTDFDSCGFNQLKDVVDKLKTDPNNRRLVVSAWNPKRMNEMALPPCHYAMEFYAEPIPFDERVTIYNKEIGKDTKDIPMEEILKIYNIPRHYLSLRWIQRSCDMALGIPFNIMSYAVLLELVAKTVGMKPKILAGSLGNAHIYKNHIEGVMRMLDRNPYLFGAAKLDIPDFLSMAEPFGGYGRLVSLEPSDVKITDYESYPSIKFDLFTDASKQS